MKNVFYIGAILLSLALSAGSYAGATSVNDPQANSPCDSSDGAACGKTTDDGMPVYSFKSMLAGLSLQDTPLSYTPPVGQTIAFVLYYNAEDSNQGALFTGGNFGKQWTSNWLSYIQDNPQKAGDKVLRYVAGGGAWEYSGYQPSTGQFAAQHNNAAQLVRLNDQHYELYQGDGSIERFAVAEDKTLIRAKCI